MTRGFPTLRRLVSPSLAAVLALGASLVTTSVGAAPAKAKAAATPTSGPAHAAKRLTAKRHDKPRGISKWQASVPTRNERERADVSGLTVNELPWALVTVRDPVARRDNADPQGGAYAATDASDRAALAFVGAKVVDARSGWAQWKPGSSVSAPPVPGSVEEQIAQLQCLWFGVGCGGGEAEVDVDLHLWVNAKAGHTYLAVCRVKFDDAAGELAIVSEGGASMKVQIDHTGKHSDTVSFVVDGDGAGWHGVAISSGDGWWTTGCSVDEV